MLRNVVCKSFVNRNVKTGIYKDRKIPNHKKNQPQVCAQNKRKNWHTSVKKRIEIIYLRKVHKMRIIHIQKMTGINYTTVHGILKAYDENKHINYKYDHCAKEFLLQFRQASKDSQRLYRQYRANQYSQKPSPKESNPRKREQYRWISNSEEISQKIDATQKSDSTCSQNEVTRNIMP